MKKLLVIEDDPTAIEIISATLSPIGELSIKKQLSEGEQAVGENKFDLLLLDLNLPDGNGLKLVESIKNKGIPELPIVILSGDDREMTKVEAFNLGVNDYIQKPYSALEMRARVERFLKDSTQSKAYLERGPLKLNLQNHTLEIKDQDFTSNLELTTKEYKILKTLMERPEIVLDRNKILELVWGHQVHLTDRTIDTHLAAIRKKLGKFGRAIRSVRGVGYQFLMEN